MAARRVVLDYSRFLNRLSQAREPAAIRVLTEILARSPKTMISLAGGLPNQKLFPFESASIKLRDGTTLELDEETMGKALQYGPSAGNPDLLKTIHDLVERYHAPPRSGMTPEEGGLDICMVSGCQDGLGKTFDMLIQPGDNVLCEHPTYSGTITSLRPLGCNLLAVDNDKEGLRPDRLLAALGPWSPRDADDPASKIPKILYTIPNGANPTGYSLTEERKREIYEISQEYNLLILEDDPYYYLQFSKPYAPSFLSLDTDGRVLRFDSFSKILSSGLRIGFVSGPQPLVYRIVLHNMVTNMHPSGLSQVLINEILTRWGEEGFEKHVDHVVEFYRNQKTVAIKSANKWLTGLAEWSEPDAGMFLWMKIKGLTDTSRMVQEKATKKEVLLAPGNIFLFDDKQPSQYVRASFSTATPENIDKGIERLASLIREELEEQGGPVEE